MSTRLPLEYMGARIPLRTQGLAGSFDTFHPFPKLPVELRLKIWGYALPDPRVVEIVWCGEGEIEKWWHWWAVTASRHQPSGLLRANWESRDKFLKHYAPFCRYSSSELESNDVEPVKHALDCADSPHPICYVNFDLDTVYIGAPAEEDLCVSTEAFTCLLALNGVTKLRFLAWEFAEWNCTCSATDEVFDALSELKRLQSVIVGVSDLDFYDLKTNAKGTEMKKPLKSTVTFVTSSDKWDKDSRTAKKMANRAMHWLEAEQATDPERICPQLLVMKVLRGGKSLKTEKPRKKVPKRIGPSE